jgi:alanyl-tRNA synthetase
MTRINRDTVVTFPEGRMDGISTVLGVVSLDHDLVLGAREALIVAETPFHPVDHRWPDQPGDTGVIEVAGRAFQVVDCLVGAVADESDEVLTGASIPVRRGEPGWQWLVLHAIAGAPSYAREGSPAVLTVDSARRRRLSAAHTACHLSGLALNRALKDHWRKSARSDSLGNPDFDGLALATSRISTAGFRDGYRVGRSLRKHGFDRDCLPAVIATLGVDVTECIRGWLAAGGPIRIVSAGPGLAEPRTWECQLPEGIARLACGGTHPDDLRALSDVAVTGELSSDATEFQLTAKVSPRDEPSSGLPPF